MPSREWKSEESWKQSLKKYRQQNRKESSAPDPVSDRCSPSIPPPPP